MHGACWRCGFPRAAKRRSSAYGILTLPSVRVIAVAKPELAPYGLATLDTLQKLGISEQRPKVVYAENISIAKQYGQSKNADVVFTAYSLSLLTKPARSSR